MITQVESSNFIVDVDGTDLVLGSGESRIDYINNFILAHGDKMTNAEMSEALNTNIAGCIAALKRKKIIDKQFLLSDVEKNLKKQLGKSNIGCGKSAKFKNANTESKAKARRHILDAVDGVLGKILTLPSYTAKMEELINNKVSKKYTFDAVERSKKIYVQMIKKFIKLGLVNKANFYNSSIAEVIYKAKRNEYAHLILDYCGTFETFHEEIEYAIMNKIVQRNGTICMTFSKRGFITPFMEKWAKGGKIGVTNTDAITNFLTEKGGNSYKITKVYEYRTETALGEKKGSNMILVILKRIR